MTIKNSKSKSLKSKKFVFAVGRRKTAVARVRLFRQRANDSK